MTTTNFCGSINTQKSNQTTRNPEGCIREYSTAENVGIKARGAVNKPNLSESNLEMIRTAEKREPKKVRELSVWNTKLTNRVGF